VRYNLQEKKSLKNLQMNFIAGDICKILKSQFSYQTLSTGLSTGFQQKKRSDVNK